MRTWTLVSLGSMLLALGLVMGLLACTRDNNGTPVITDSADGGPSVTLGGVVFELPRAYEFFTWSELRGDVVIERQPVQEFASPGAPAHYYEAVYVKSGNLNWFQAAYLAQDAGGYLACPTCEEENEFVFGLVNDERYFWAFPDGMGGMNHHGISIGPFIGGYQPVGSVEPDGGWRWISGEVVDYTNWAQNLDDGVIDQDPRDNTQPNDSGNSEFGQRVMGFGEMNRPVGTWGDYMDDVGTYGLKRSPGRSYGFVIEYDDDPR